MIHNKLTILSYLYDPESGSEAGLGPAAVGMMEFKKTRVLVEQSQLKNINGRNRKLYGIDLVTHRFNGRSRVYVGIGARSPAQTDFGHRVHYQLWLWYTWLLSGRLRLKGVFWHVCFAQLAGLNPWLITHRDSLLFGPVGGRAPVFKYKWLPVLTRVKSFVLIAGVYAVMRLTLKKAHVIFVHPYLADIFPENDTTREAPVLPAVTYHSSLSTYASRDFSERNLIIFVGRKIETKNPDLTNGIFRILAPRYPALNFLIVGPGWKDEDILPNFSTKTYQKWDCISGYMQKARLSVFLSFELAGEVSLQCAAASCPTFCFEGFGADFLVNPSPKFKVAPPVNEYDSISEQLAEKISMLIADDKELKREGDRQNKAASRWSKGNKASIVGRRLEKLKML